MKSEKMKDYITISINPDLCNGCSACLLVCPTGALAMDPATQKVYIADRAACVACGECIGRCPTSALQLIVLHSN